MSFTIISVFDALKLEKRKDLTWAAGDRVRDRFIKVYGRHPEKALRPKTNARGSHCFAVYPDEFWEQARSIVAAMKIAEDAQGRLFEDPT